ncbi:MAG: urate hydroxylase PuuD [Alphaproteobacteria bacterium]|nr:urate hydroxylase PuuD [Alphaproteobacteria bacterium]MBV9063566.1 urate hydroxylase PuuD [Alphaproteobacteria bacterium]
MAAFFANLRNTVIAGLVLAVILFLIYLQLQGYDTNLFWRFVLRWLHVISGVMWIGLLWYFNFVSTPTMPKIPAEMKPALGRFITPAALFWFRWAAMATLVFGLLLAFLNDYLVQMLTIDASEGFVNPAYVNIGIGAWLAIIMWFNVWFVIWPNQQRALNIDNRYPDLPQPQRDASAKTAGMFSRINTMLSIPMLFAMVATAHLYGAI